MKGAIGQEEVHCSAIYTGFLCMCWQFVEYVIDLSILSCSKKEVLTPTTVYSLEPVYLWNSWSTKNYKIV